MNYEEIIETEVEDGKQLFIMPNGVVTSSQEDVVEAIRDNG